MRDIRVRLSVTTVMLCALSSQSFGLARWNGDALGGGNNPPAQNAELPAAVKNTFVRILLGYSEPGQGVEKQIFGTGMVIGAKRDSPTSATGKLCVLTGFHNTEATAVALTRIARVFVAFGDGSDFRTNRFSVRYTNLVRPAKNEQGRAPDLTIIPIEVTDWANQVPAELQMRTKISDVAESDKLVLAGFGKTGVVKVADRKYDASDKPYGTLRTGHNTVDRLVDNTTNPSRRTRTSFEYAAIRSDLDFTPDAPGEATKGEAHFLDSDSGGPTLKKVGDSWDLVGIHSESVSAENGGVDEGMGQFDVRVNTYKDWVNRSCHQALVPEPGSMIATAVGLAGVLSRRRKK